LAGVSVCGCGQQRGVRSSNAQPGDGVGCRGLVFTGPCCGQSFGGKRARGVRGGAGSVARCWRDNHEAVVGRGGGRPTRGALSVLRRNKERRINYHPPGLLNQHPVDEGGN